MSRSFQGPCPKASEFVRLVTSQYNFNANIQNGAVKIRR